jgi:hypothetical protein
VFYNNKTNHTTENCYFKHEIFSRYKFRTQLINELQLSVRNPIIPTLQLKQILSCLIYNKRVQCEK